MELLDFCVDFLDSLGRHRLELVECLDVQVGQGVFGYQQVYLGGEQEEVGFGHGLEGGLLQKHREGVDCYWHFFRLDWPS